MTKYERGELSFYLSRIENGDMLSRCTAVAGIRDLMRQEPARVVVGRWAMWIVGIAGLLPTSL